MEHYRDSDGLWTEESNEISVQFPDQVTSAVYLPGDGRDDSIESGSNKFKRSGVDAPIIQLFRCIPGQADLGFSVCAVESHSYCTLVAKGGVLQLVVGDLQLLAQDGTVALTVDRVTEVNFVVEPKRQVELYIKYHNEIVSGLHQKLCTFHDGSRDTYVLARHSLPRFSVNRNFEVHRGTPYDGRVETIATCVATFAPKREIVARLPTSGPGYVAVEFEVSALDEACMCQFADVSVNDTAFVRLANAVVRIRDRPPRIVTYANGVTGDASCNFGLGGKRKIMFAAFATMISESVAQPTDVPRALQLACGRVQCISRINDWAEAAGACYVGEAGFGKVKSYVPDYGEYQRVTCDIEREIQLAKKYTLVFNVPWFNNLPLLPYDGNFGGMAVSRGTIRMLLKGPTDIGPYVDNRGFIGHRPYIAKVEDLGEEEGARVYAVVALDLFGVGTKSPGTVVIRKPVGISSMEAIIPSQKGVKVMNRTRVGFTTQSCVIQSSGDSLQIRYMVPVPRTSICFWVKCFREVGATRPVFCGRAAFLETEC